MVVNVLSTVHRGIRQGCALSGMLYALSIEPLLCQLRQMISGLEALLVDFFWDLLHGYHKPSSIYPKKKEDKGWFTWPAGLLPFASSLFRDSLFWRSLLSSEERALIKDYGAGVLSPDEDDLFPKVTIDPDLQDCQGPLLDLKEELSMDLSSVSAKL
ncbi:hypothetical protein AOLI_G00148110 [Acnodon oligacanthus]